MTGAIVLVAAVAGFVFSLLQQLLTERRTDAREERRRQEERDEHRREFQRTTLLELQDALYELMRSHFKISHDDVMEHRRTGDPIGLRLVGEPWDEMAMLAIRRVRVLATRVSDASVRFGVERVDSICSQLLRVGSEAQHDELVVESIAAVEEANEAIRAALAATF